MGRTVAYLLLSMASTILFVIASDYCLDIRGYAAVGGEYLIAVAAAVFAAMSVFELCREVRTWRK